MEKTIAAHEILWLKRKGKTFNEITEQLVAKGTDPLKAATTVDEFKRAYYAKRQKIGVSLIIAGAILCLTGFGLNFCFSEFGIGFYTCLFGLAGAGAAIIFSGLVFLLG